MKIESALSADLNAAFEQIDMFCSKTDQMMKELNLDNYVFQVKLLLREVLMNAVVHGCRMNSHLKIETSFIITENEIIIEVEDPGEGFNWKNKVNNRVVMPTAESGRGLSIIEKYASEFIYNRKGNRVIVKKIIGNKE